MPSWGDGTYNLYIYKVYPTNEPHYTVRTAWISGTFRVRVWADFILQNFEPLHLCYLSNCGLHTFPDPYPLLKCMCTCFSPELSDFPLQLIRPYAVVALT